MSRAVDFPTSRTVEHTDDLPPGGVLVGGGEMGSLIRAFDWSATPVGPVASWPQSLRAAVNIILGSRYPMFVWWGRRMVNFYNDSYIPLLGKRHPAALGRSAFDVWADVWPICGPQAEAVLNEGKSTWNEELLLIMERNGFTEEAYFTFSYSPVLDDLGRPGGIFCAVTEDTARVLGRRRLKTLRDLGERALVESKTDAQACQAAAKVLQENPYDFAFALMYLLDADGRRCRLAETVNYAPGAKASPPEISLFDEGDLWSFKDVLKTNESRLLKNLRERFGPMPAGSWTGDRAESALVLPLAKAGVQDLPAGFLVAGLSPRLEFNDDYHGFLELAAGHIATAIANARAYQTQRERAESLAELDRAKTAFFSNISHEFRTPLTLMLGPLDELLSNPDASLGAEKREQLTVMHRNSRRLLKLVNTLLEFSRIEAGRVQASYEPTELGAFTADLCGVFRAAIEKAGLRLVVDCPLSGEAVYVDRDMWEKIVLNLVSNAFKFTFAGEIAVRVAYRGATAELSVRDTGIGIPEDELGNIFKRFHRVEGARGRTFEGSGIGLALVQELVKIHAGRITVQSTPGKGTEFLISIPLGKAHLPADRIRATSPAAATSGKADAFVEEALRWLPEKSTAVSGVESTLAAGATADLFTPAQPGDGRAKAARVLVADDNADMRGYLDRLLRPQYEVVTVSDGESALGAAQTSRPDIIVTDLMMPRLDGFGLLRALRSDPNLQTTPVIFLSARAGEESRVQGLMAGADDYLIKPFSARELLARVESHLKLARLRRESFECERRLRAELEEQRRKAQEVIESITDAFVALDRGWRFSYVNGTAERLFGKPAANLIGKSYWEEFPAMRGTSAESEFRRALSEQVSVEFETFYAPGQRWFEGKAYPSAQGLAIYYRDITERKTAQEAVRNGEHQLRQSELRLQTMAESLPNLVWTDRPDGQCDWLSSQWARYTGIPENELLGLNWLDRVIHPDDRERTLACWQAACADRGAYDLEYRIRRYDGQYRWFKTRGLPIRDEKGTIIYWFGTCTDIEDMKQAEVAIARLAGIVEYSDDAIISKDLNGTILSWNKGAERIFGYTSGEIIGKPVTILIPSDRYEEETTILERIRLDQRIDHYETIRRRKDGKLLHISLTVSPIKDPNGNVIGASKVARDITDKVRAREELERVVSARTRSLREAIAQMEEFSYSVSHDLRSPVRAMRGYAKALAEDYRSRLDEEALEYLDRIIQGSSRMERLIHDVLTYSRVSRMEMKLQAVSLEDLVRDVVAQYPELDASRAEIIIQPGLPGVVGHEPSLGQALANLLANAVKFVAPGIKPRVHISAEQQESRVTVRTRDNGIGVKPEHQARLFGMFERVHPDDKYEGTGIGLAMVRKTVERMGGKVGVESDGVNGSTFWIELPGVNAPGLE